MSHVNISLSENFRRDLDALKAQTNASSYAEVVRKAIDALKREIRLEGEQ